MASISVSAEDNIEQPIPDEGGGTFIRVIVADSQAIFRAGLRKIFAVEDDIRVVGQAETLSQALAATKKLRWNYSAAGRMESPHARLSRNCSSSVCAKYQRANPGWIAVEFTGFWKHTVRKERVPRQRVPRCS